MERAEDVDVHPTAVGQRVQQLEVGVRHAHDPPAAAAHRAFHRVRLGDDLGRVRVRAQVGEVGVGVVTDHLAVAHRAEQAAVGEVCVVPVGAQVGESLPGALDDLSADVVAGLGEDPGQVAGAVDGEPVPVVVDELERGGLPTERHGALEALAVLVAGQGDRRGAHQTRSQGLRPRDLPAAGAEGAVARGGEGPDVGIVEEDPQGPAFAPRDENVVVGHAEGQGRGSVSALDEASLRR
ncbi:hypothetical protein [Marmoricola sp. OAE513]|uniref:hypothetical protein n=1 Tax=Marmoricola sp. OAE513 TaxID=2817894 RepID=UPI003391EA8A